MHKLTCPTFHAPDVYRLAANNKLEEGEMSPSETHQVLVLDKPKG